MLERLRKKGARTEMASPNRALLCFMLDGIGKVCPMFLKFFVDVNASTATIGIKKEGKWSRNAGRRLTSMKTFRPTSFRGRPTTRDRP